MGQIEDELKESFKIFVPNNEDKINIDKLKKILTNIGKEKLSDQEFNELLNDLVIDVDGCVKIDNLVKILLDK